MAPSVITTSDPDIEVSPVKVPAAPKIDSLDKPSRHSAGRGRRRGTTTSDEIPVVNSTTKAPAAPEPQKEQFHDAPGTTEPKKTESLKSSMNGVADHAEMASFKGGRGRGRRQNRAENAPLPEPLRKPQLFEGTPAPPHEPLKQPVVEDHAKSSQTLSENKEEKVSV